MTKVTEEMIEAWHEAVPLAHALPDSVVELGFKAMTAAQEEG